MNSNDIIDVDNHIHENYIYHNEEKNNGDHAV